MATHFGGLIMARVIHKQGINPGKQTLKLPPFAKILHVGLSASIPSIWYEHEAGLDKPDNLCDRDFLVVQTGKMIEAEFGKRVEYIGTLATRYESIFHVYEVKPY